MKNVTAKLKKMLYNQRNIFKLQQFSTECRKRFSFVLVLFYLIGKIEPLSHPVRCKIKTDRSFLACLLHVIVPD